MNSNNILEFSLDFTYEGQSSPALRQAAGEAAPGRCVVLCGSSGCGKSTLLRCVNRLIPQFYEGQLFGFCRLQGQDGDALSIGEAGRLAASVFQDPRSQFFTLNSSTEVAFGLENFGYSHDEMVHRVEQAFSAFGLTSLQDRNVFSLSSGQRQLVAILSAWAMDTDILVLDEPTANLDDGAVRQLHTLLLELRRQGKTLLISEHRLSYLTGVADEYWIMESGEIRQKLTASEMLALPDRRLAELGLRTTDTRCIAQELHSVPVPDHIHTFRADHLRFAYSRRGRAVLEDISLEGHTGEVIGLTGANGCGKTTFGKLCAGLLRPEHGGFSLDGVPLSKKALRRESIFIMQEAEFQFFTNSVENELRCGLPDAAGRTAEIEELLRFTGLWELRRQHPFSLSGGQMQKLVLLLACLSPKPIVLLDEPTAGLDRKSLEICAALIRRMQQKKLILIITHDPELIARVCTRCAALEAGKITQIFDLTCPGQFDALRQELERACTHTSPDPRPVRPHPPRLDPRVKLITALTAMVIGLGTHLPLMLTAWAAVLTAVLWERRWGTLALSGGLMAFIFSLYGLWPCTALSFVVNFFPRIFLMGTAAALILPEDEAPRTIAALRLLHVPEQALMVLAVMFRFFPVLHMDLGIMHQSIRTRGFFPDLRSRLRAVPAYAEIMIVPMVFRVLRIAEALSASAETRGIALSGHRESWISLRFRPGDAIFLIFFFLCIIIGILL